MSFVLPCPQCGPRSVYEFRFGGEVKTRPNPGAADEDWFHYTYTKANSPAVQKEWWYHRSGCRQWLQALRNTTTNEVMEMWLPE
jgi:sarcosine oxidase subunit delta